MGVHRAERSHPLPSPHPTPPRHHTLPLPAVDEEGAVLVHAIYEPPQQGSADSLQLERGTLADARADFIAERMGCASLAACVQAGQPVVYVGLPACLSGGRRCSVCTAGC